MPRLLVPVDGSPNSQHAVWHVLDEFRKDPATEIHVLNVQAPFSSYVSRFSGKRNRAAFHRAEAEKALKPMRQLMNSRGVPYVVHTGIGNKARMIADTARRLQCDHIVMSTARKNSLTRMLENSVTIQVLELTKVPVKVISGDAISRWERYGIPAGVGAVVGSLLLSNL